MKMKDTFFSFPRFANYFKKVLVEDRKRLLQRIVTVFGLLLLFAGFISKACYDSYLHSLKLGFINPTDPAHDGLMVLFVFGSFIGAALSASYIMEPMSSKTGRIYALMLPVTPFEKYFVRWFIYTIGYFLAYYFLFELVDVLRVAVSSVIYPEIATIGLLNQFDMLKQIDEDEPLQCFIAFYFLLQSLFALGSSLWPKHTFLKSFTVYTLLGMALIGFFAWLFDDLRLIPRGYYIPEPTFSEDMAYWFIFCCLMLVTLFFWWLAYKRFKEMEVVNRW